MEHLHGAVWLLFVIAIASFALSFIGATVGLVLGHLRLPLLVAYLGSPGAGAAMNLVVSATGALSGTYRHARGGRISWVGLAMMGVPSAIGAVIAVLIFIKINPLWSYFVIGIILIVSGANMIRKKPTDPPPGELPLIRRIIVETIIGLGLGALAAITGLMLGSLRLPMMIRYLRMDPKEAVGTNMAVGCLTGLVGAITSFAAGSGSLNLLVLAVVVPPTILGGYMGGWLTGRFSKETVQRLAGWVISITGIILIGQGGVMIKRKKPTTVPPVIVEEIPGDDDGEDLMRAEPEPPDEPDEDE